MLSIVIPTFNTASMTLATARAAVEAAPTAEVIIVDDGSTDGTHELIASSLPDVCVLRLDVNRRFAAAANFGVSAASGSIVLLLNSDAVVTREAIDALLRAFDDPRLGVAGARLLNPDGTPQWSGGPMPTLAWLVVLAGGFASLLPRRKRSMGGAAAEWVSGAAMAFRREVWNVAGPLSEEYRFYAQDLEFCMRARSAGWDVRVIDEAHVMHRGGATLAHDPALLWLDLLTWARKHRGRAWAALARVLMIVAVSVRVVLRRDRAYASAPLH